MAKILIEEYPTKTIGVDSDKSVAILSLLVARGEREIVSSQRTSAENAAKSVFEVLGVTVNSASGQLTIPEVEVEEGENLTLELSYKLYKNTEDTSEEE